MKMGYMFGVEGWCLGLGWCLYCPLTPDPSPPFHGGEGGFFGFRWASRGRESAGAARGCRAISASSFLGSVLDGGLLQAGASGEDGFDG